MWQHSLLGLEQLLVRGWRVVGMVGVYREVLGWWNGMGGVYVLLAKVTNRREPVHCSWLLEIAGAHLDLHAWAAAIGIGHMRGQLVLAIWGELGHLG